MEEGRMAIAQRLAAAWRALLNPVSQDAEDTVLALRRELATVQLERQETRDALERARAQMKALEETIARRVEDRVEARLQEFFANLVAPLSQLKLQEALIASGTEVASRDVMILVRQFTGAVEAAGVEPIGQVGETQAFDPEINQPVGEAILTPGAPVVVRFPGYRFRGRVLRKAFVEVASHGRTTGD